MNHTVTFQNGKTLANLTWEAAIAACQRAGAFGFSGHFTSGEMMCTSWTAWRALIVAKAPEVGNALAFSMTQPAEQEYLREDVARIEVDE